MDKDKIKECGIIESKLLYVKPSSQQFPYIYREAIGVQWDTERKCLTFPVSIDPSKIDGFHYFSSESAYGQILDGAKEQGCLLYPTEETIWVNISEADQTKILRLHTSR